MTGRLSISTFGNPSVVWDRADLPLEPITCFTTDVDGSQRVTTARGTYRLLMVYGRAQVVA